MRIAVGEASISSAVETVVTVTPHDSAHARLAVSEAQLKEAAAEAVEELRHVCQTEALAERTLRRQLEQQLEHAQEAAAAAATNAENVRLTELSEAAERLEGMQEKEAELQTLLRSNREEFVVLQEKLKVAVQDSAAVLMAEEQVCAQWRVKLALSLIHI